MGCVVVMGCVLGFPLLGFCWPFACLGDGMLLHNTGLVFHGVLGGLGDVYTVIRV